MALRPRGSVWPRFVLMSIAWLSPFVVMCWGATRILLVGGRWRRTLVVLSISANLLFVGLMILAYYEPSGPEQRDVPDGAMWVAPECVQRAQGPLQFCEPVPESELASSVPNAVYVAYDGLIQARFEFADEQMEALEEVTLSDKYGRPWIDASLVDGTVIYSRYTDLQQMDPKETLLDKNGDGLPDVIVDWDSPVIARVIGKLEWRRTDTQIGQTDHP